jgi:hypothetical protein
MNKLSLQGNWKNHEYNLTLKKTKSLILDQSMFMIAMQHILQS